MPSSLERLRAAIEALPMTNIPSGALPPDPNLGTVTVIGRAAVLELLAATPASDGLDVERLRSPRNSLGKLALPKGLMEWAVQDAWDAPGVRTDVGDPADGIVMTDLAELADAICTALAARLSTPSKGGERPPNGATFDAMLAEDQG